MFWGHCRTEEGSRGSQITPNSTLVIAKSTRWITFHVVPNDNLTHTFPTSNSLFPIA